MRVKIRRCCIMDGEVVNGTLTGNILKFERNMSFTILNTSILFYSCFGGKSHKSHLIRFESTKGLEKIKLGSPIDAQSRKRMYPRDDEVICPLGKTRMRLLKGMVKENQDETVDVYQCYGNGTHRMHKVKISHGMLNGIDMGILVLTMEKKENYEEDAK